MGFPNDLDDVVAFKIHPAIGVARISNSDEYYVFGSDPGHYKANKVIKRQAVQFRVFAYGENHVCLGELVAEAMESLGITAVWRARVANRKIARLKGTPLSGTDFVIQAEASSDDGNEGRLIGQLPGYVDGTDVPLGQITATGLFVPPPALAIRETPDAVINYFPALGTTVADTCSDGSVRVDLTQAGQSLKVLPACILVAPQDFSPDVHSRDVYPHLNLTDHLRDELGLPATASQPNGIHNQTTRTLDLKALESCTADFNPGYEASFGPSRTEVFDIESLFYRSSDHEEIHPSEIRVRYREPGETSGAVPGQLTSGLCSPWQGDFTACTGYWTENLPEEAFLDEDTQKETGLYRREYADHSAGADRLVSGDDYHDHVEKIGIVRLQSGRWIETERDPGDDLV